MQTQTAFQAAFSKVGFDIETSRLRAAAYSALRRADISPMKALAQFQQVIETDRVLMRALAFEYLKDSAADMRGEGLIGGGQSTCVSQAAHAAADQSVEDGGRHNSIAKANVRVRTPSSTSADCGGHATVAEIPERTVSLRSAPVRDSAFKRNDIQISSGAVAKPNSPRGLSAIASIQPTIARSIFDTFTVRDGTPIGDLAWIELEKLAEANEFESRVLRFVSGYASNVRPGSLVRDVVKEGTVFAAIKHAEEAVNV